MKQELGTLRRVNRVVKVLGMVNATPDFAHHPYVINGCSDLFVEVFGEAGLRALVPNADRQMISPGAVATELPNSVTEPDIAENMRKVYEIASLTR